MVPQLLPAALLQVRILKLILESKKSVFIYNLSFLALVCAISMDLFVRGYPEKIFYLVSYISFTYTAIYFYKHRSTQSLDKPALLFFITLFLVGASRLSWSLIFKHTEFNDIRSNYFTGGKRFMIAAFLLFYFYQYRTLLKQNILKLSLVIMFLGFFMSLWHGDLTLSKEGMRDKWTSDAATTGAYLAVIYSMVLIVAIRAAFKDGVISVLLLVAAFLTTMGMIVMTQTRSAIILAPLLYALFFAYYYRSVSLKIKLSLVLVIVLSASSVVYLAWDRISQISTEISEYDTNNDTSIGARFSMWSAGAHSIEPSFLGQSADQRYKKAIDYIDQYQRGNPEAKRNVIYHLHNDLLETLSLQGIFGFVSLVMFFIAGFYFSLRKGALENYGTLFIMLPVFILGIADTVLIQSNTVLVIIIALALSFPLMKKDLR